MADVFRNVRRSLTAIIGIVLAITLIAGENITLDAAARTTLNGMLESVPVDYNVCTNNRSYNAIAEAIKVKDVKWAEVMAGIGSVTLGAWGVGNNTTVETVAVRPGSKDHLITIYSPTVEDIAGDIDPQHGGIVIQQYQAAALGVDTGDQVFLKYETYNYDPATGNLSSETRYLNMTVSNIVTVSLQQELAQYIDPTMTFTNAFVNIDDRDWIIGSLNISSYGIPLPVRSAFDMGTGEACYGNYTFYVAADRDKLIAAGDTGKTNENYVITGRNINRALRNLGMTESPYGLAADNEYMITSIPILMIMQAVDIGLMFLRMIFLGLSIPALALGVYLALISIETGMTGRRRELGILKTRGATSRQLFGLLLTESFILGIIAGIIGLLLGILVSKVLIAYAFPTAALGGDLFAIYISTTSVVLVIIIAVVLTFIASYRPAKRVSNLPAVEMLEYYAEGEVKIPYKPTIDLIFVGLSIFTFALMFIVRSSAVGSLYQFICLLMPLLLVLTPLCAFLFIIGFTRLITRSTTKLYDGASRVAKAVTKDLWYVVNKNIVRNPRRASNVCLLIAVGLAFGIIVSSFMETEYAYEVRLTKGEVGGDIAVYARPGSNYTFQSNLSAVQGVEAVTPVISLTTTSGENLIAFDSSTYNDVVEPDQYFFSEGNPGTVEELGTRDTIIINNNLAESQYLSVGDEYSTRVLYPSSMTGELHNFTIIGKVKLLPGTSSGYVMFASFPTIYVDMESLNMTALQGIDYNIKFLIKVQSGYDPSNAAENIRDTLGAYVGSVVVMEEEISGIQQSTTSGTLFNFLMTKYFFAILIIAVGLGLVVFIAAVEREHELAGIMARGASTKQLGSILFGEGLTLMVVGVALGLLTGLLAGYMVNELISFIMSTAGFAISGGSMGAEAAIDRSFTVSWMTLALIIITIIALIISSFLATLRVRRIDVAKALKERGG